jgi:hypothetical protein
LATFAAIVHSEDEGIVAILELLARGMRSFDKPTAKYWSELLEIGLEDTPARETWRELEKMVISSGDCPGGAGGARAHAA